MKKYIESVIDGVDSIFAWISTSLKQSTESYCELETADTETSLVAHDGSLISVIEIQGAGALIGLEEFKKLRADITQSLHPGMSQPGHAIQMFFSYSQDRMEQIIEEIFGPAKKTAKDLELELDDLPLTT